MGKETRFIPTTQSPVTHNTPDSECLLGARCSTCANFHSSRKACKVAFLFVLQLGSGVLKA